MKIHLTAAQLGLNLPEGVTVPVELTKENIQEIIRLSSDRMQEIMSSEIEKIRTDICQRINSWLDAARIVRPGLYLSVDGSVESEQFGKSQLKIQQTHVPSERHAKSMLAFAQLSVISEAYNRHAKVDRTDLYVYTIVCVRTGLTIIPYRKDLLDDNPKYQIKFLLASHASNCLEKFEQLWKDYWMID